MIWLWQLCCLFQLVFQFYFSECEANSTVLPYLRECGRCLLSIDFLAPAVIFQCRSWHWILYFRRQGWSLAWLRQHSFSWRLILGSTLLAVPLSWLRRGRRWFIGSGPQKIGFPDTQHTVETYRNRGCLWDSGSLAQRIWLWETLVF